MMVNILPTSDGRNNIGQTISYNRIQQTDMGSYRFIRFDDLEYAYLADAPVGSVLVYDPSINRNSKNPNIMGYIIK